MIHTVPIPTSVQRLGCAPGSDCCDSCKSHKLSAVQCDQDGNCYTDGVLTSAPLTGGGSGAALSPTTFVIGAVLFIGLLELTSRRRR